MSLREVRKNDRQRVTFGFSFTSYWMKIGPSFLSQSYGVVSANQHIITTCTY